MEWSPSQIETFRHQFDRLCRLALKGEAANYFKELERRSKKEVVFADLSEQEVNSFSVVDEYDMGSYRYKVLDYEIEIKDDLIAEALQSLSEKRRDVILLSYFLGMSDADIARKLNLVRSTIHEHRTRSLQQLKQVIGSTDEKNTESE